MVFGRDRAKNIEFEYSWTLEGAFKIKDPISGDAFSGDTLRFHACVGLGQNGSHTLMVNIFNYDLLEKGQKKVLSVGMERDSGKQSKTEFHVNCEGYPLLRNRGRPWSPVSTVRFYGFPDEVVACHQNANFVQELNLAHEKLFRSLFYLGPLRMKAERLYSWTGIEPESVGYSGENTVAAILAAKARQISPGYRKRTRPFERIIAQKIQEMGLIDEFTVIPISEERQEYEVKVRTRGSSDPVDLPDVGFGISQVLPVIVQCYYAPRDSIIIMEQPEIHLHPSAQAALADVMIDVVASRENGADRKIQLIVETHSEHFLRRLQRRIAEDVISEKDVSAYFADVSKTPARLEPLQIDILGSIRNWPRDFFGDEMGDITAQAKAAMTRRASRA